MPLRDPVLLTVKVAFTVPLVDTFGVTDKLLFVKVV